MPDLNGQWVGEMQGTTNQGTFALALEHEENRVYGHGKFYEPALGGYDYNVQGISNLPDVILTLIPFQNQMLNLGRVEVRAKLTQAGEVSGTWTSTIGTKGSFVCRRCTEEPMAISTPDTKNVFIIHGHDELTKEKVARFIEGLEIETIILHEQINKGMTIIEKFEEYSRRANFAVALFTPDDIGHAVGNEKQQQYRPRQNVVLELGYFIGRLGRNRICVLYRGDVELPSDMLGVAYTPLDERNAWHLSLARELKGAGYEVDLNRLIE